MCRMGVLGELGSEGWGASGATGLCQGHRNTSSSTPLPWVLPGGCASSSLHVEAG